MAGLRHQHSGSSNGFERLLTVKCRLILVASAAGGRLGSFVGHGLVRDGTALWHAIEHMFDSRKPTLGGLTVT
jgi:hypothetical protein